ncbi:MAG: hypothetical protein KAS66_07960 [Candidatus Omnitrophica bacterium]|nr:hypothetical protein [Candidatus Omnitrophota bacterium]
MDDKKCIICSNLLNEFYPDNNRGRYHIVCPACGAYQIYKDLWDDSVLSKFSSKDLKLFSGYLRNNFSPQNQMLITGEICVKIPKIILPYDEMSITDKINGVFKDIYGNTTKILGAIKLSSSDVYRFYLATIGDLQLILKHFRERGFITFSEENGVFTCFRTIKGWEEYEKLKEINISSNKVFIACAFGTSYQENLVKTIRVACKKRGFDAELVSDKRHNDDISHKIIGDIKESRFVIADFTDQNNGAYFEAGYAMGMGLEVIKLCRKDHLEEKKDSQFDKQKRLHFDTRQYSHIAWENDKWTDFEEDLVNQIKATIK